LCLASEVLVVEKHTLSTRVGVHSNFSKIYFLDKEYILISRRYQIHGQLLKNIY
jgi:hypothetical protein